MNEGTLRIPDWAQFQQQSDKSTRPRLINIKPTKVTQLVFHKSCTQGREKLHGWLAIPAWSCEQTKLATECSQKQNRLSRCQEKFLVQTLETIATATCAFPQDQLSSAHARTYRNIIYNACSNRNHPPTSPITAPGTKNDSHDWSSSHIWNIIYHTQSNRTPPQSHQILRLPRKTTLMVDITVTYKTLFTMCGARGVTLQHHQTLQNLTGICWKRLKRHVKCAADPSMMTMKPSVRNPPRLVGSTPSSVKKAFPQKARKATRQAFPDHGLHNFVQFVGLPLA